MTLLDPAQLALFVVAAFALNLTPGPDMLYVSARSFGQGRRVGVASALGITTGRGVHMLAAVAGLSAVIASSAWAATLLRACGALVLIVLGLRLLWSTPVTQGSDTPAAESVARVSPRRAYWQGVATNVLNPKVALFYLAFLPQFVDPARGSVVWQLVILGLIQNFGGTAVQLAIAWGGGTLGDWLARRPRVVRFQQAVSGGILVLLGYRLLAEGDTNTRP